MTRRAHQTWLHRIGARWRLSIALAAGGVTFVILPVIGGDECCLFATRLMSAWDNAAMTYLILSWLLISGATATETRLSTQHHRQSDSAVLAIVVIACLASAGALAVLMNTMRETGLTVKYLHVVLAYGALGLSWLVIHTRFAVHYAHRYYNASSSTHPYGDGLEFPGKRAPDYFDFAYVAFVVGMTSQVSDVVVTTRRMRRLLMLHSVLAFAFNIAVLALSINILGSIL